MFQLLSPEKCWSYVVFVGESKCKLTPIGVKPLSAYTYLYFTMWQIMAQFTLATHAM